MAHPHRWDRRPAPRTQALRHPAWRQSLDRRRGVGSLGGLVNQQRKRAGLEDFTDVEASVTGDGPRRLQVDTNRAIADDGALRLNLMSTT